MFRFAQYSECDPTYQAGRLAVIAPNFRFVLSPKREWRPNGLADIPQQ